MEPTRRDPADPAPPDVMKARADSSESPSSRDRSSRAGRLAVGVVLGLLLAVLALRFPYGLVPGDAMTYLAAGERLNAGHPLYALSPGDRPVVLEPPYWTVPLLSPPPIAVAWRPLALLGEGGAYVWWAFHATATLAAILLVAARRPWTAAVTLGPLILPFAYELSVANLNGFVLLGLVLAWRSTALRQERAAGAIAAALTAFKLTPAILGWWLIAGRRWTAAGWALLAGIAILLVSVVGAGLDAHLDYLSIVAATADRGARPLSLAGLAGSVGMPADLAGRLPMLALIAGLVAIWLLRRRPDRGFQIAVITLVFASPTVNVNWYALIYATLAPLAWPWEPPANLRPAGMPTASAGRPAPGGPARPAPG